MALLVLAGAVAGVFCTWGFFTAEGLSDLGDKVGYCFKDKSGFVDACHAAVDGRHYTVWEPSFGAAAAYAGLSALVLFAVSIVACLPCCCSWGSDRGPDFLPMNVSA